MIPILFLGVFAGFLISLSFKDKTGLRNPPQSQPQLPSSNTSVQGEVVSYLKEFQDIIRKGHRPSQWLVTEAISEAFAKGDWRLAQTISNSYPSEITIQRRSNSKKTATTVSGEVEEKSEPQKQLAFKVSHTSTPIDGISNDEWRMFVEASRIEDPEFTTDKAIGMFRQNRKRLEKLGINPNDIANDPAKQYEAFEKEIVHLMEEGKPLINQSVAMPIDVNGETVPVSLSGLFAVMRTGGTANAEKWIDKPDERKKFVYTTEAFKRCNGCF